MKTVPVTMVPPWSRSQPQITRARDELKIVRYNRNIVIYMDYIPIVIKLTYLIDFLVV